MPRLVSPSGSAVVDVSSAEAADYLAQGWTAAEGESVGVLTSTGGQAQVGSLSDVTNLQNQTGLVSELSLAEAQAAQAQAEYDAALQRDFGGWENELAAGVLGAASTATFGATDALVDTLDPEALKIYEANPKATTVGKIAGVAPGLLAGGTGALGRAASLTPIGATARLGSAIAGPGGGIVRSALGAAVEGGIAGASMAASQAVVDDVPLASEAFIERVGAGALYTGLLGGVVGGGVTAGVKGFNAARSAVGSAVGNALGRSPSYVSDMGDISRELTSVVNHMDNRVEALGKVHERNLRINAELIDDYNAVAKHVDDWSATELRRTDEVLARAPVAHDPDLLTTWRDVYDREARSVALDAGHWVDPESGLALQASPGAKYPARVGSLVGRAKVAHRKFTDAMVADDLKTARSELVKYRNHVEAIRKFRPGEHPALPEVPDIGGMGLGEKVINGTLGSKIRADVEANVARAKSAVDTLRHGAHPERVVALDQLAELGVNPKTVTRLRQNLNDVAAGPVTVDAGVLEELRLTHDDLKSHFQVEPKWQFKPHVFQRLMQSDPPRFLSGLTRLKNYHESMLNSFTRIGRPDLAQPMADALERVAQTALSKTSGTSIGAADLALALGVQELPELPGPFEEIAKAYAVLRLLRGSPRGGRAASGGVLGRMVRSGLSRGAAQAAGGLAKTNVGRGVMRGAAFAGAQSAFSRLPRWLGGKGAAGLRQTADNATSTVESAIAKFRKEPQPTKRYSPLAPIAVLKSLKFIPDDKPEPNTLRGLYESRRNELGLLMATLQQRGDVMHNELAPLRDAHYQTGDAVEARLLERPAALLERMPKDPGSVMRFGKSGWEPSEQDLIGWAEFAKGVFHPTQTIVDALHGYLTPQAAEGLRIHNPGLFAKFQVLLWREPEVLANMDLQARTRIAVLLGMRDLEPSASTDFVNFNSMMLTPPLPAPDGGPGMSAPLTQPEPSTKAQHLQEK